MSTPIEQNTEGLEEILRTVNALPNAGGGGAPTWKKVYECSDVQVTDAVKIIEIDLGGELGEITEFAIYWSNSKTSLETACKGQMSFNLDGIEIGYYCFNIDHSTYDNHLDIWADLGRKVMYKLGGINSTQYNVYTPYYIRTLGDHTPSVRTGKLKVTFPAEWAGKYGVTIYTK